MKTRRLPGTELELSVVGMGCWPLGGEYWGPADDAVSTRAIHSALDAGINWFDTAPLYGRGRADQVLMEALGNRRGEVLIATKVGVRLDGIGPQGHDGHAHSDHRPDYIAEDAQRSVRQFGGVVDLLQLHWPGEFGAAFEDTIGALERLCERGDVRYWGLCNESAERVALARQLGRVASLQTPYSLMRREFEQKLEPTCREHSVGVLAYEALCRGLLTGKYRTRPTFPADDLRSRDDRFRGSAFQYARRLGEHLELVATRLKVPVAALPLGWVLNNPSVTAVIAGCRTAEQVKQNAMAARLIGRTTVWSVMDRILEAHGRPPW